MPCCPQRAMHTRQKPGTSLILALVYQGEHGRSHVHTKSKEGKPLPQSLRWQGGYCVPTPVCPTPWIQDCYSSSAGVLSPCLTTQHRVISLFLFFGGAGCGISTGLKVALLRLLADTEGMSCPKTKLQLPFTSTVQSLRSFKAVMWLTHRGLACSHRPQSQSPSMAWVLSFKWSHASSHWGQTQVKGLLCTGLAHSTWSSLLSFAWLIWPLGCLHPNFFFQHLMLLCRGPCSGTSSIPETFLAHGQTC